MRPKHVLPLAGLPLLACIGFYAGSDGKTPATVPAATEDGLAVCFSPKGGCTEAVVDALGKAKQTVLVQAYSFTSAPIAKALVDAHKRGVKVTVVVDKSQETEKDPSSEDYTVSIPRAEAELIAAVKKLIDDGSRIYSEETRELPNIHFDRHLYQPLLIERGDGIKSDPPGLNESEQGFVRGIRDYVRQEAGKSLATKEVFLLRNLSRGKGVGFFENEGFYPDFILWIREGDRQRIVFVEPHGMPMEKTYGTSDKARLHERLKALAEVWGAKAGHKNVTLDSFIISATPYDTLRGYYGDGTWSKQEFADCHILFFERAGDYKYAARPFG